MPRTVKQLRLLRRLRDHVVRFCWGHPGLDPGARRRCCARRQRLPAPSVGRRCEGECATRLREGRCARSAHDVRHQRRAARRRHGRARPHSPQRHQDDLAALREAGTVSADRSGDGQDSACVRVCVAGRGRCPPGGCRCETADRGTEASPWLTGTSALRSVQVGRGATHATPRADAFDPRWTL